MAYIDMAFIASFSWYHCTQQRIGFFFALAFVVTPYTGMAYIVMAYKVMSFEDGTTAHSNR